ncbi:MAG: hypothetical protein M3409_11820 [Gemmatimonadota bacterium]|nr:hypothetical protein [Gemmatimonadota bacterium]
MSWEALLFLVFLLLPLLQGLLERKKGPPRLPPPDADHENELPGEGSGWAEGWGAWPAEELPEEDAGNEEEAPRRERDRVPILVQPAPTPRPEPAPVPIVVSMEPLAPRPVPVRPTRDAVPDRAAEHARFHARVEAPAVVRRVTHRTGALQLRNLGEVRRAVLLAEVLGPPRALRPLEEDR